MVFFTCYYLIYFIEEVQMKKSVRTLAIIAISASAIAFLAGCVTKPEVLEHKGTAWGTPQPSWVAKVVDSTSQQDLAKELGINKHIWVLTKSGKNLDFLKTWVDQVDARAEIASSIEQSVFDFVNAAQGGDEDGMKSAVARYSGRLTSQTIQGLTRETDWWSRTRSKNANGEYVEQYNYMVVYSLDEELLQKQIKAAYDNIDDDIDKEELLIYLMSANPVVQSRN